MISRVRDLVVEEGQATVARVASELSLRVSSTRTHLSRLVDAGQIVERPERGSRCSVFLPTEEGRRSYENRDPVR